MKKILLAAAAFMAASTSAAYAEDLQFNLINRTNSAIVAFYVSHSGSSQWEENLFGGDYLPPGNQITVNITDGRSTCRYDIRAEFRDGDKVEDYRLDLCELGSYTFK